MPSHRYCFLPGKSRLCLTGSEPGQGPGEPSLQAEHWKGNPGFFLQVGSAILHQTMAHFVCSEAARLGDSERIAAVCSLLQQPNPDIQLAILTWVIAGEGGSCNEVEKALGLTLLV